MCVCLCVCVYLRVVTKSVSPPYPKVLQPYIHFQSYIHADLMVLASGLCECVRICVCAWEGEGREVTRRVLLPYP